MTSLEYSGMHHVGGISGSRTYHRNPPRYENVFERIPDPDIKETISDIKRTKRQALVAPKLRS
jgi:hypothetical protein